MCRPLAQLWVERQALLQQQDNSCAALHGGSRSTPLEGTKHSMHGHPKRSPLEQVYDTNNVWPHALLPEPQPGRGGGAHMHCQ